jgi:hypothetical protein
MAGSMRIPLLEADAADASAERLTRGGVPWPLAYLLCPWTWHDTLATRNNATDGVSAA